MSNCVIKIRDAIAEKVLNAIQSKDNSTKDVKTLADKGRVASVALVIAGIALIILGLSLCSVFLGSLLGVPLITIGLTAIYFGYNGYQICTNLKEFAENQVANMKSPQEMKDQLKKRTFYFEWVINSFADAISRRLIENINEMKE